MTTCYIDISPERSSYTKSRFTAGELNALRNIVCTIRTSRVGQILVGIGSVNHAKETALVMNKARCGWWYCVRQQMLSRPSDCRPPPTCCYLPYATVCLFNWLKTSGCCDPHGVHHRSPLVETQGFSGLTSPSQGHCFTGTSRISSQVGSCRRGIITPDAAP